MDDDKVVRIAHIRKRENGIQEQSLQEHLEHVAALCKKNAIVVNMSALSELTGLMRY